MPRLRVHNLSISLDGYVAGPGQNLDNPLGEGGLQLHEWLFATRTFRQSHDTGAGGERGLDDDFAARANVGIGATIMGRNMFGPVRGPWAGSEWSGWWGADPPFHHPVFVLTHHPHPPITMRGGTTFHFVDDGVEAARARAFEAAGGNDVLLGGGAATIQQYLTAGLVDEMHLAIVPLLLRRGERLFDRLDGAPDGYRVVEHVCSPAVVHVRLEKVS